MTKFLLLSLSLVFSLLPSHVFACPKLEDATLTDTCVVGVKWGQRKGTWFHEDVVPDILFKLRAYPQLELQVSKFTMLETHRERETASLRSAVSKLQSANVNLQRQADLAAADARATRAELAAEHRWYRSPVFWGITMFFAGVAAQYACCSGK